MHRIRSSHVLVLQQGTQRSPMVKIAQAYLEGKLDDKTIFKDIMFVMAAQLDREERGVGMQNFKYPPTWEEMCQILHDSSPQTYNYLAKHIRMPTDRNIQCVLFTC